MNQALNLQPTLEDQLVLLRPLQDADFHDLYLIAKDPMIWKQHPAYDRYKKEVFLEFFSAAIKSKGAFTVIEKVSQKIIGTTRFHKIEKLPNAIEIGWTFLARDKWGGRYNKAMKTLMINYAFNYYEYVILYIGEKNIRSQKAAIKLGAIEVVDPELAYLNKEDKTEWTYYFKRKQRL